MSRALSYVCMIVGVIGIVVFVLLIPAVWVGHGMATQAVTDLASAVRDPLQQVQAASVEFKARIDSVHSAVGQAADAIAPAYARLREAYINLRERAAAAAQAADAIRRLLPGLNLPTLPVDQLVALDSQLQDLDSAVRSIGSNIDSIFSAADTIGSRAQLLQVRLDQTEASAKDTITTVAIVLSIICAYVALLHAALLAYGRRLRTAAVTTLAGPTVAAGPLPPAEPALTSERESTRVGT